MMDVNEAEQWRGDALRVPFLGNNGAVGLTPIEIRGGEFICIDL
jgi:hypothetical protein